MTLGVATGWRHRTRTFATALECAHRALSLNPHSAWAHVATGFALAWNRQPEDAVLHYQRAIELEPDLSYARTLLAAAQSYVGHNRSALRETTIAQELVDGDLFGRGNAGVNDNTIALAHFVAGDHQQGVEFGRRALVQSPNLPTIHRILVANHALKGEIGEAKRSLARLRQLVPNTSLESLNEWLPFIRVEERERFAASHRLAGLS